MDDYNYIITTDGHPYMFSVFQNENNGSANDFTNSNMRATNSRCLRKGGYIDIYTRFVNFYGSDDVSYISSYNYYFCGFVLALTSVKNNQICAIVVEKCVGQSQLTKAQRQEEISNNRFTYDSTINVKFLYATYTASYDYTKYKYRGENNNAGWHEGTGANLFGDNQIQTGGQLFGVPFWQDGEGSGSLLNRTLLFPVLTRYKSGNDYIQYARLCTMVTGQSALSPALSFNSIMVSEDPEDFVALGKNYCTPNAGAQGVFTVQDDFLSGYEPPEPPAEYPFEDDFNGGGGGTGEYTDTSDTIPTDGVPTNSAIASGFINAYLLTQQQCADFHDYLYSTNFLTNVKKLMNDPIDYIISFSLAPYTPDTSANTNIYIGGTDSEISASRISSGYKTVDCGTIQLKEFWGKFYDYNPYTKVQIYLPFIGVRPLDIDDVMAGTVSLIYRIDVLTGECVATISVNNTRGTNGAIYHFNGNCHSQIPVSGKNALETLLNVGSATVGLAGAIARGDVVNATGGLLNVARASKEQLEHAGELTGATGLLANYTPFLMVSRPSQSLAQNYNHYRGFISNVTAQLGTLSGYTQVAELVQTNIHCTETEFEEINELLKEGVYL